MTEREEWHMGLMTVVADFVINGKGSIRMPIIELIKWSVQQVEKDDGR